MICSTYVVKILLLFATLASIASSASLNPSRSIPSSWLTDGTLRKDALYVSKSRTNKIDRNDQDEAPTNEHHTGRVQIKVYRGPDTHGDKDEHFAPYGFWVKQPADEEHN